MASMLTYQENNVGILAMEVYFPSTYVSQPDLEAANGVSAGKYTIGLGQDAMAFTGDQEDINSVALTAVHSLMEKYGISPNEVGRLEVGTESLVDKSKSTKTVLMSLFAGSGNTDIEGATVINACYGGTAALLNALSWADSSAWDGRFAIVVAADIAVYSDGPARPTGGCGSVAMLVGRNAPLQIDLRTRTTHATHVWDFFKPNMDSEYPEVNGALSQTCYLQALEDCYSRFVAKSKTVRQRDVTVGATDHFLFHSPYNKLVQKSFARLTFQDMRSGLTDASAVAQWKDVPLEQTYEDRGLEAALKTASAAGYKQKVALGCEASKQIGNTYTAAVYMNLACLVSALGAELDGKSVVLFSYGSGALASMLSVVPSASCSGIDGRFSLARMQECLNVASRLSARERLTPDDLTAALKAREDSHGFVPFKPTCSIDKLSPGTYYLTGINALYERTYARKPLHAADLVVPPLQSDSGDVGIDIDDGDAFNADSARLSSSLNGNLANLSQLTVSGGSAGTAAAVAGKLQEGIAQRSLVRLARSETKVWASGRPNVKVVVTGIAAALPGRDRDVFSPGVNNVRRIIAGESFISPIPLEVKEAMLDKNVTLLKKNQDGSTSAIPLTSFEESINVCASIGRISMTNYGVAASLASTMDRAVQVAIAAGLEALRDAGIVNGQGEGTSGWVLPEHFQNSTGIVYATSFPALDAAIGEVTRYFKSKTLVDMDMRLITTQLRHRLQKSQQALRAAGAGAGAGNSSSANGREDLPPLSAECEVALKKLEEELALAAAAEEKSWEQLDAASTDSTAAASSGGGSGLAGVGGSNKPTPEFQFDRKFLFRVLVLGNAQLAQIIKARGPNMQTNAACAGATQAIALAYDMIQVGRAERVIVVAGDSASSDNLMPWLGNGFRILGAACISADPKTAARPFSQQRSGMILGSGGIGMILESEDGARRRHLHDLTVAAEAAAAAATASASASASAAELTASADVKTSPPPSLPSLPSRAAFRCRLLGTLVSNSAYHGAAMDRMHIAEEMERFIAAVEREQGISRADIAKHGVYFSHETGTHASPSSSCAANEIYGLRQVFGKHLKDLLILNTKGFTGHPMGVSFEDVVAAEVLVTQMVPPVANFSEVDPYLGTDLKISRGGLYPCKYAMRFAAGFGSHIALALYGTADTA